MQNRIKDIRHELGLTQNDFADLVKLSRSSIALLETQRMNLTVSNAAQIARFITLDTGRKTSWHELFEDGE